MIRLAGTPLVSTVLVGTDKHDESLGAAAAIPIPTPTATSGYSGYSGYSGHGGDGGTGQLTVSLRPTQSPATGTPATETPPTEPPPTDDTEDFEAIPATTDTNGNRTPELVVTDGPRLTSGLPRPEWLPPD
jgi:hypothetical protein